MKKNTVTVLLIAVVIIAAAVGYIFMKQQGPNGPKDRATYTSLPPGTSAVSPAGSPTPPPGCDASNAWVTNPQNPPTEIPYGTNAQICQFHQFAWQWFIALMSMAGDSRVFQNEPNYPLLQAPGTNSCTASGSKNRIFIRTRKDKEKSTNDFNMPQDINQAMSDSTIYDQNGNVVFYEVRFSRNQCSVGQAAMFPPGTTEIKVSYRVITEADKPNYVWINADINGDGTVGTDELLGMVGFHLVKSTALHPEFVWATFEHKQNVPDCQAQPSPSAPPWSFTSVACAGQLPNSVNPNTCNFNMAPSGTVLSGGPPTQICRVYHDGSSPSDNQYTSNVADIDSLNTQLVGVNGFITALPASNPLAVLKNYMLVGALWFDLGNNNLPDPSKQRGSIELANTTMETEYQQAPPPNYNPMPYTGTSNLQPTANCFVCHNYTSGNNVALSHTFPYILGGSAKQAK